jgi:hypothetical protein
LACDAAIDASGCKSRQKYKNLGGVAEPEVLGSEMVEEGLGDVVEEDPPQGKAPEQVDAKVAIGRIASASQCRSASR